MELRNRALGSLELTGVHLRPADVFALFRNRRVLVTGHTGFKGSWLTAWLSALGAEVTGLALAPDQGPDNLFERAAIAGSCHSHLGDIRDTGAVEAAFQAGRPEIVFHLAAQPLVLRSYEDPCGTIATNVLGTAHVLEAARACDSVRAIVCVTTDKVYRNREWAWPYRESDELGGYDPYSASKAAAELVVRTFQTALAPKDRPYGLATARGGNVLGGGDWSANRLVPDMVRALRTQVPLAIRHPDAVRPWQHVLDLCYAYMLIAATLFERAEGADVDAWNIGPSADDRITVRELADLFFEDWGTADYPVRMETSQTFESHTLSLDSSLARARLGWAPTLDPIQTIRQTASWYRDYLDDPSSARARLDAECADFQRRLSKESSL